MQLPIDAPATVFEAFARAAARHGEKPFLAVLPETAQVYGLTAGEISYGEALATITALTDAYRAKGYGAGHRVGILMENRPAFFLHWFALNALGVSLVPDQSRHARGRARISDRPFRDRGGGRDPRASATMSRPRPRRSGATFPSSRRMMNRPRSDAPAPRPGAPDRDSECALLYTSGTTGRPKGCVLPNEYFLYAGHWYANIGGLIALNEGAERMLTPLPVFHMNAMAYSAMAMVTTGGCLIALDRFHPKSWWASVKESRATIVHYLGVMPPMLMGAPESAEDKRHSVRFGFGAGVDRALHDPFEARFGFPLVEAWAMTETGAGAVVVASREPRHTGTSCFGRLGRRARGAHRRRRRRGSRRRRARRTSGPPCRRRAALRLLPRISQGRRGHRGSLGRRLVSHRRRGAARRRMARFISWTARRTSSAAPARTSRPSRSRAC